MKFEEDEIDEDKGLLKGVLIFDAVVPEQKRSVRFELIQSGMAQKMQFSASCAWCLQSLSSSYGRHGLGRTERQFLCQGWS